MLAPPCNYLSTRTVVEPDLPAAEAVMFTLPSLMPFTRPVLLTVARFVFELVHVTVTPGITLLLASYTVAVNWIV